MKERINYWILLAQLNPLPVAIGVGVLLLLLGLFFLQRRRARSPKRVRSSTVKSTRSTTTKDAASSVSPAPEPKLAPDPTPAIAKAAEAAAAAGVIAAAPTREPASEEVATADADRLRAEDSRRDRIAQVTEEAKKLTSGAAYDESVIGSDDRETRQLVGAELLSAIVGRSESRREHARAAFMKHGYFDDATRDLRIADSANERAAAARRLSFVNNREATPHLVGALDDPSPDVRRTAVEALMDLRDPAAIGPLNSLMQTENDRKVPRTVIKQAIEACATAAPDEVTSVPTPSGAPAVSADSSSPPIQTEREVIEL
jgi:HEAT repeat protein